MHILSKIMLKTRDECLKEYGSTYFINELVRSRKLFKIEKGIYSNNKNVPLLAVLSFKYPNAVITMQTAFYIYGLTDEIPDLCYMATKRENAPISDKRIKQVFIPNDLLSIGAVQIEYQGYKINIFDKERMLLELIRYKSKMPFNYYKDIIGNYRRILPILNVEKIRNYLEYMPKKNLIKKILQLEVY